MKRLLAVDPFAALPPHSIRMLRYRYSFTRPGDGSADWWRRELVGEYLRPVTRDDPTLRSYLQRMGWQE